MSRRMRLSGRTALVTGAAGGIGRAISSSLARRGCNLALADVDEANLAATAAQLAATGVRITTYRLDVSDEAAINGLPDVIARDHGGLDILINNAGVAVAGTFQEVSPADFDWLMSINFWGVVRMTRAFLPLLHASDEARIVNLSSIFGIITPPGQTAYCASKFAVRGFSESLRHELADSNVGVTVVHPGGVATSIARSARLPAGSNQEITAEQTARFEAFLRLPPEKAGEIIVGAVERRRPRILVGSDARRMAIIERLMPVSYWKIIGRNVE